MTPTCAVHILSHLPRGMVATETTWYSYNHGCNHGYNGDQDVTLGSSARKRFNPLNMTLSGKKRRKFGGFFQHYAVLQIFSQNEELVGFHKKYHQSMGLNYYNHIP